MVDSWLPAQTVHQADFEEQWWDECPHLRQMPHCFFFFFFFLKGYVFVPVV